MGFLGAATANFKRPLLDRLLSKEIPYPVYEENGNELTALNGEKSFCFECYPQDLEQLTREQLLDHYTLLRQSLNSLADSTWAKIYRWNGTRVLLSSNDQKFAVHNKKTELDKPKESFFGELNLFSDINFFDSFLTVNTQYWRLIHLQTPPSNSYESFLDDFKTDYMVAFKRIGKDRAKQELYQKRRSQGIAINTTHQNHEGEAAYDEANKFLQEILLDGEGLFRVNVWFVVKSSSLDELNYQTNSLIKELREKGAQAFVETTGLDYFFTQLILGAAPSMLKSAQASSGYLANLLPNSRDSLHKSGLGLFATNDHPIYLDLYDEYASNQNWLITGACGEGKSFLAGSLVHDLFNRGAKIGIFDLGGSLRRVALYLGGVDLTERFNPMQFRCPYYLKRFIISVLGKEVLDRQKEGQLFELIEKGLDAGIEDFRKLIEYLSSEIAGINYYFSELWEYFTDESIKAPDIFYLDTEGRPEALIAPYLIFAKELSERQEGKIVNVYDECWDIFDKCPEIIRTNAKTSRKNLIGNLFLTQEIVELSREHGDVAKAVVGNTYGKIYFYQPDLEHPILTDFEKEKIRQVKSRKGEYSEFLFSSPDYKKIARLVADPLIYELCNSEKEEVKRQQEFIRQYDGILSYRESIDKWVELLYG